MHPPQYPSVCIHVFFASDWEHRCICYIYIYFPKDFECQACLACTESEFYEWNPELFRCRPHWRSAIPHPKDLTNSRQEPQPKLYIYYYIVFFKSIYIYKYFQIYIYIHMYFIYIYIFIVPATPGPVRQVKGLYIYISVYWVYIYIYSWSPPKTTTVGAP